MFFEKQLIDEIGFFSVKLEKIILFLMFVGVLGFLDFNLFSWIATFLTLSLLFTGFWGAYKRNVTLLRIYVTINLVLIALMIVSVIVSLVYYSYHTQPGYEYGGDTVQSSMDSLNSNNGATLLELYLPNKEQPTPESSIEQIIPLNKGDHKSSLFDIKPATVNTEQKEQPTYTAVTIWYFLWLLIAIIIFAYKIASIVIAIKVARMLRERQAHNLAHPIKKQQAVQPQVVYIPLNNMPVPYTSYPGQSFQGQPMYFNPYLQPQPQKNIQI